MGVFSRAEGDKVKGVKRGDILQGAERRHAVLQQSNQGKRRRLSTFSLREHFGKTFKIESLKTFLGG